VITTGGRLYFAVAAFGLVAAVRYFLATGGEDGGALTLLFIAAGALVLGGASVAVRDNDLASSGEKEPVVVRSALPAPWPAVAALGAGVTIVGWSVGGILLYVGLGIIGVALLEWMVQGWAERSTADPAYNKALRDRIMFPIEVPVLGLAGLGLVILTFSRVLLALPNKDASTIVAIAVATLITATAFIVASRPRISSAALSWVLAIAAVALLAGGIVGGVSGERKPAEHTPEAGTSASDGNANNDQPGGPAANQDTPDQQATTTTLAGTSP
jgi:hypothetical protein